MCFRTRRTAGFDSGYMCCVSLRMLVGRISHLFSRESGPQILRLMSLLVASPEEFRQIGMFWDWTSEVVSVFSPYAWFDSGLSIMRQSSAVGDFHTFELGSCSCCSPLISGRFLPSPCAPGCPCSVSSLPEVVRLVQQRKQHMRQFPEALDVSDFYVKVRG